MANRLASAARRLRGRIQQHASQAVLYSRSGVTVGFDATAGKTEFDVDSQGLVERIESHDWIFPARRLILAVGQTLPQAGDQITEPGGSTHYVYEVTRFGNNPPYTFLDPGRTMLRVHTKLIKRET